MIDPRELKKGDTVIFGGVLKRKVKNILMASILFEDYQVPVLNDEPFWKIAELKKPKLPNYLIFQGVEFGISCKDGCFAYSPESALDDARTIVMQLEAAGVK